jgi:hypothetical protein
MWDGAVKAKGSPNLMSVHTTIESFGVPPTNKKRDVLDQPASQDTFPNPEPNRLAKSQELIDRSWMLLRETQSQARYPWPISISPWKTEKHDIAEPSNGSRVQPPFQMLARLLKSSEFRPRKSGLFAFDD